MEENHLNTRITNLKEEGIPMPRSWGCVYSVGNTFRIEATVGVVKN